MNPGIKTDYGSRIRVFMTDILPGIAEDKKPSEWKLQYVIRTYKKFDNIDDPQTQTVLKSYRGTYIKHLNTMIERLKEVKHNE